MYASIKFFLVISLLSVTHSFRNYCLGAAIFVVTALMAIESRRLEVKIMKQKGIYSVHSYPSYLKFMEESSEAASLEAFRLNVQELKVLTYICGFVAMLNSLLSILNATTISNSNLYFIFRLRLKK